MNAELIWYWGTQWWFWLLLFAVWIYSLGNIALGHEILAHLDETDL